MSSTSLILESRYLIYVQTVKKILGILIIAVELIFIWISYQFVVITQPINSLAFVFDGVNFGASDFAYSAFSMVSIFFHWETSFDLNNLSDYRNSTFQYQRKWELYNFVHHAEWKFEFCLFAFISLYSMEIGWTIWVLIHYITIFFHSQVLVAIVSIIFLLVLSSSAGFIGIWFALTVYMSLRAFAGFLR